MLSKRSAARSADTALHLLFEANRLLREEGELLAATVGQTHARRMVLQSAGSGLTVPDIARTLGLQRQGVQRITDELVTAGLGGYVENPRHRRSKLFAPTEQGVAALEAIRSAHEQWLSRIEARTPNIDWTGLRDDLGHLVRQLQNQDVPHADGPVRRLHRRDRSEVP